MASPLFTCYRLRRRFLGLRNKRPKPEVGRALVLLGGGETPVVLYPGQTLSPGESVWGKYDTICEVDITQKHLSFRTSAPAMRKGWEFEVSFSGSYQVFDPLKVVKQGIQDADLMLQVILKDIISQVTQQYDIEDSEAARVAVRQKLERGVKDKAPFKLNAIYIELEPDQEAKELIKERGRHSLKAHAIEESQRVIEAQAAIDTLLRQIKRDGEQEMVGHYEKMLDKGIYALLAKLMAESPENTPQVANFLLQMQQQDIQGKVQILQTMMDKDMIEDWQLKELVEEVIQSTRTGVFGAASSLLTSRSKGVLPDQSEDGSKEQD